MKNASKKSTSSNSHFYQLSLRAREGGMIILGSIALFLLISFLTFHRGDPGWSTTGGDGHVANAGGYVGAWLADFFLYFLGYFAYVIPIILGYSGWQLVKNGYIEPKRPLTLFNLPLRISGFVMMMLSGCAFFSLQWSNLNYRLPFLSGGIIGSVMASWMESRFNLTGASILLLACIGVGSMLWTGMSWLKLSEKAGLLTIQLFQKWFAYSRKRWAKSFKTPTSLPEIHLAADLDLLALDKIPRKNSKSMQQEMQAIYEERKKELEELKKKKLFVPSQSERMMDASLQRLEPTLNLQALEAYDSEPMLTVDESEIEDHTFNLSVESSLTSNPPVQNLIEETENIVLSESESLNIPLNPQVNEHQDNNNAFFIDDEEEELALMENCEEEAYTEQTSSYFSKPRFDEFSHSSLKNEVQAPRKEEYSIKKPEIVESDQLASKQATSAVKTSSSFVPGTSIQGERPSIDLLDAPSGQRIVHFTPERLESMSRDVEARLKEFGVEVRVVAVHPGPVITRFEMQLAPGVKVSRISGLAKDLARSLSVISVRIVEVIAGKSVVGLEVPNEHREIVRLKEILASDAYAKMTSPLSLSLGKDISGHAAVVDLAKMPHLLVAGTTGSGKSVGVNAMLLGLLYKSTPEDVRMILVDPKMLELSIYEGIPHLLTPVVTDMKEAANALRWCVAEMERRYKLMAGLGVRNLASYNQKVKEAIEKGQPLVDPTFRGLEIEQAPLITSRLPYIVVVIDEFADMMMVVGKKVEQLIARIAQKARAAGIHLILATQRPSVDVITGLIKANIPTRIAFQVSSKIDSRTVLDQGGAEQLLGQGDMLYLPPGTSVPVRVHGAFVDDDEVHRVVEDWKRRGAPEYIDAITSEAMEAGNEEGNSGGDSEGENDPLYHQAVHIVTLTRRASISNLQRRLKIGYNRAARLIEDMEMAGIVSAMESNGSREVLAPPPPEA